VPDAPGTSARGAGVDQDGGPHLVLCHLQLVADSIAHGHLHCMCNEVGTHLHKAAQGPRHIVQVCSLGWQGSYPLLRRRRRRRRFFKSRVHFSRRVLDVLGTDRKLWASIRLRGHATSDTCGQGVGMRALCVLCCCLEPGGTVLTSGSTVAAAARDSRERGPPAGMGCVGRDGSA